MATIRQRRAGNPPMAQNFHAEDDRIYTEEDYALPAPKDELPDEWATDQGGYAAPSWTGENCMPDEAFLPDEEEALPDEAWGEALPAGEYDDEYAPLFEESLEFDDIDPLSEELLTEEEQEELRRSHWQLLAGLADFAGVILGTAAILVLVTLLVSLINWLVNDMSQSFILLQKHL